MLLKDYCHEKIHKLNDYFNTNRLLRKGFRLAGIVFHCKSIEKTSFGKKTPNNSFNDKNKRVYCRTDMVEQANKQQPG